MPNDDELLNLLISQLGIPEEFYRVDPAQESAAMRRFTSARQLREQDERFRRSVQAWKKRYIGG